VRFELAAGRERRHLQIDLCVGILIFAAIGAPALLFLLLLVLGVDDLDGEGTFGAIVLRLDSRSLARGSHCCLGWLASRGSQVDAPEAILSVDVVNQLRDAAVSRCDARATCRCDKLADGVLELKSGRVEGFVARGGK